jgi:MoaA/NifB/PqqE/SkfB family radical SAM enzyme
VLVNISLEGFQAETDARRGKGVFLKIMESMDNLREAGVPFGFSSMVTRHNAETIASDEFNDMLIRKGCLVGWHFLYIPEGRDADVDLMPTAEQRDML